MLRMAWDMLSPLALIALALGLMMALRNMAATRRVYKLLRAMPTALRAAWHNKPVELPMVVGQPAAVPNQDTTTQPASMLSSPQAEPTLADVAALACVPGGGSAMLRPPGLRATHDFLRTHHLATPDAAKRYLVAYGWYVRKRANLLEPDLVFADLVDTFVIGILGPQQYGKTNEVFAWFMLLTFQHPPQRLQFVIIDLKDNDFRRMENSPYTFLMTRRGDQLEAAETTIELECQRRADFFEAKGVSNWRNYDGADRPPLLVVYISELGKMVDRLGGARVNKFLDTLTGTYAAFGIRVIVDTHLLQGQSMLWRSLLTDRLLGPMPSSPQQDQVNGDLSTEEIIKRGAIPPSQLHRTYPQVFTVVSGGEAVTVRGLFVPDEVRQRWFTTIAPVTAIPAESGVIDQAPNEQEAQASVEPGQLVGTAAQLYMQQVELGEILRQPQVEEQLRALAMQHRNPKNRELPNVRRICIKLFEIEPAKESSSNPSGGMQGEVKSALIRLGLMVDDEIKEPDGKGEASALRPMAA